MEKKEVEILESIQKDMSKIGEISKEAKEAKAEAAENAKKQKELEDEVAKLNKEKSEQGATLKDIQEEVNNLKAKGGRQMTTVSNSQIDLRKVSHQYGAIWQAIEAQKDKFRNVDKNSAKGGLDTREVITKASPILSGNLSGNPYFDYLPATMGQRPFGQTRIREIVPTYQSEFDSVIYSVQNAAPNSGSFNYQATEGTAKAEIDYTWKNVTLNLEAFAAYCKVSRQSLRNIPFLQSYLPMNLMEDMLDQEDKNFSNEIYSKATGSTTGATGVPVEDLICYLKNLVKAKYSPSAIAIDPDKWFEILITKPGSTVTNYSLPAGVVIDAQGMVRLLGIPVYPVNWLTGGKTIVGDFSRVGIVESEGLTLMQTDSDQDDFIKNLITFRLERTENIAVFRTDAFIATTVS